MDEGRTTTRQHTRHLSVSLARRIIGWAVLGLGVLGVVFPVLPGVVLLALGIVILGPRDPLLRRVVLRLRLLVRRWSQARHPWLRASGQWMRRVVSNMRRTLRAQIHAYRCGGARRSAHAAMLALSLLGMVVTATAIVILWRALL